jgi:hypothetical protein
MSVTRNRRCRCSPRSCLLPKLEANPIPSQALLVLFRIARDALAMTTAKPGNFVLSLGQIQNLLFKILKDSKFRVVCTTNLLTRQRT